MDYPVREKVLAYVTRGSDDNREVLVFEHVDMPDAGIQVPGGSLDPGETPEQGVLREAFEESGLSGLTVVRSLGRFRFVAEVLHQVHDRHVYHLVSPEPLPETWDHVVSDGVEDKGMLFRYRWMDLKTAERSLIGEMGDYVKHL